MPRKARVVVPGVPHHVVQRGNNQQDVFFVDQDRQVYLRILKEQAEQYELEVLAYCLMRNHVHLVVTPHEVFSLAKGVGRTNWRYAQGLNEHHNRSGHVWQNRFHSCALDESHTVAAVRYVEQNPVRVGAVAQAWEYGWSSAAAHAGEADPTELLDIEAWRASWRPKEWEDYLRVPEGDTVTSALRSSTARGGPLGTDTFLDEIERTVGRRVRALPVGRPRKRARPE